MCKSETQDEYLGRICGKPKPKRKIKARKSASSPDIFSCIWENIQAMQQGTYKPRIIGK